MKRPKLISKYLNGAAQFHLLKDSVKRKNSSFCDLLHGKHFRREFYTLHQVAKCPSSRHNETVMLPCLKFNYAFSFLQKLFVDHSDKPRKDFQNFLSDMGSELIEDANEVDRAIDLLLNFFKKVVNFSASGQKPKSIIVKVIDLNRVIFSNLKSTLNWMHIFNNFYMKNSHLGLEDEVLIQNSEV